MRGPTVAPLVLVSVICWPTIGARLESNCEHELLEVLRVRDRVAEHVGAMEAEGRVDAAVVQEAEAAHLRALVAVVPRAHPRDRRHAEHADLLVEVPQVRDLEHLGLVLERGEAVGAEEARSPGRARGSRCSSKTVSVTGPMKRVASGERRAHELVVERADRVRRIHHLQDEVGEALHVRVADRAAAAEQPVEGDDELLERLVLRQRVAAGVVAARAIAAPVHRPVVRHAAQALRRHRALQRMEVGVAAGEADRVRVVQDARRRGCRGPRRGCRSRRRCGTPRTTPRRCST